MFSKTRINEQSDSERPRSETPSSTQGARQPASGTASGKKATPSRLSADLTIIGNLRTAGDIEVEGSIEGDIHAHLLTVGESATIRGEIVADDVIVNGRVIGRVRGLKVRLSATARVEGDIVHKTIAIESGAHFEGSVQRQEDPTADERAAPDATAKKATAAPASATATSGTGATRTTA